MKLICIGGLRFLVIAGKTNGMTKQNGHYYHSRHINSTEVKFVRLNTISDQV